MNLNFFKNELNDLLNSITMPADPNNVNIGLFCELLNYYNAQMNKKEALQKQGINYQNIHFAI